MPLLLDLYPGVQQYPASLHVLARCRATLCLQGMPAAAAGPGSAPADPGPTRNAPPVSNQAMLPPPAPTVLISIMGSLTGWPPILPSVVWAIIPSTRATSVDVPPISRVMACLKPEAPATNAAPTTPAAGPERRVRAASRRAVALEIEPPFDCMMRREVCLGSDSSSRKR